MELFISMKAETINKGIYFTESNIMQMPTAQSQGYFVAEFREGNDDRLKLLRRYVEILQNKLEGDEEYFLQPTSLGFKLHKKVDENVDYMEAWERWVKFSRNLLRELEEFVEE